jgi:hypothetical protein
MRWERTSGSTREAQLAVASEVLGAVLELYAGLDGAAAPAPAPAQPKKTSAVS